MNTLAKLLTRLALVSFFGLTVASSIANAAGWHGLEPLKSRRDEVIKQFGNPVSETTDGVMRFNVAGGSVQVRFVNEQFVKAKRLRSDLVGTVLEIILEHEHSSDTPETLKLADNHSFTREESKGTIIFRNLKEGLMYTFVDGSLRTTRYTFADGQLTRARR